MKAARADGGQALKDVPPGTLRVQVRVEKDHEPHDLVVLEGKANGNRADSGYHDHGSEVEDPVEVGPSGCPKPHEREPGDDCPWWNEVQQRSRLAHHAQESRAVACSLKNGGKGGQHDGEHADGQDEEEVLELRPCQEGHEEEDENENQRGAEIRLQEDQAEGHHDDEHAKGKPRQLANAVADVREVCRQKQDAGELRELRRLDPQLSNSQPRAVTVHVPAHGKGDKEKNEGKSVQVDGHHAKRPVAQEGKKKEDRDARGRPDELLEVFPGDRDSARVDSAGIDEQHPDEDEKKGRAEKNKVEGQGDRPSHGSLSITFGQPLPLAHGAPAGEPFPGVA
jgi:hypothetical protein